MPVITIAQPPATNPNTQVSSEGFTASGTVDPPASAAAAKGAAQIPPPFTVRCDLIPSGLVIPAATVDPCTLSFGKTGIVTWAAEFSELQQMIDCTIRATRVDGGIDDGSTEHEIDVVDPTP